MQCWYTQSGSHWFELVCKVRAAAGRQLGYHVGPNERMTPLYSCDGSFTIAPIESVLAAIRSNGFRLDVTRSGYFMNAGPSDVVGISDDGAQLDPK